MMRRTIRLLPIALIACAALPSGAWASSVIGSDLANSPNAAGGGVGTVLELATTPNAIRSPIDGVVVSWSTFGGSESGGLFYGTFGNLRLRILRDAGGGSFTAVRSGPVSSIPTSAGNPLISTLVNPGLAISKNDNVGVDVLDNTSSLAQRTTGDASFTYVGWNPPIADGASSPATFGPFTGVREMLYQATIEPDADHDGYGDESQDKCPTAASTHGACNHFDFGKLKKHRKTGTATLAVAVPGAGTLSLTGKGVVKQRPRRAAVVSRTVATAGMVKLLIKSKGKRKRKLNRTGKTSLNLKVTFAPAGGTPNTETKKVTLVKRLQG